MHKITFFLFCFFLLFLFGCSRYDVKTPDTKANRNGFANIIGIQPGDEVREVYFYADELGFDPLYCFAFLSSSRPVEEIIKRFQLAKKENTVWKNPFPVPSDLFWWNADERKISDFYFAKVKHNEILYYFWHNPRTGKCQFMKVCL